MAFIWTCPYCGIIQTVVSSKCKISTADLRVPEQAEGQIAMKTKAIGCSNSECMRTTIEATVSEAIFTPSVGSYIITMLDSADPIFNQRLMPIGTSKPQKEFIPKAIRDDYYEACLIRELSPKASATLIRRCLQGMIRDFANIKRATLIEEIKALSEAVNNGSADRAITPESVAAIDQVRGIGNIGAHMEKDINVIIPVDPDEAQVLIELVEALFVEWYGSRDQRERMLARIGSIAGEKKAIKAAPPALAALSSPKA